MHTLQYYISNVYLYCKLMLAHQLKYFITKFKNKIYFYNLYLTVRQIEQSCNCESK